MSAAASLAGVWKSYGRIEALRGLDLTVRQGEILGLLGPNGAGKTTAVNLLLGLRRPDRGGVSVFGRNPRHAASRRVLGATPQHVVFPPALRVREIVDLVRAHFPDPLAAEELLDRFGLAGLARRPAGALSGGERRRLAVALAFAGRPKLVFLDEPTTGLDVDSRNELWQVIAEFADAGGSVLLTSHYLEEAERLATRIVVLANGSAIAEGSVPEIKMRVGLKRVSVPAVALPAMPEVERTARVNGHQVLFTRDVDDTVKRLVELRVPLGEIEVSSASLEEAFLALTADEACG